MKNRKAARKPKPGMPKVPDKLLAAALGGLSEGVVVYSGGHDGGLRIEFANAHFCEMVGYAPRELAGQEHLLFHSDPGALSRVRDWVRGGMKAGIFSEEGDLVGKEGRSLFAAWSLCRMKVPGRRGRTVVGCYRDITEKRHLEESLVHAQRLDAAGRMAGGVAHDFNNLISVINGYCQILLERAEGRGDFVQPLGEILRAGQKAAMLTRQLLALGRRQVMAPRVIDLNALLRENTDVLARVLGDAGVLEWSLSPTPLFVRADPDQLQQVLLNLVLNARDALRANGRVKISTSDLEVTSVEERGREAVGPGFYAQLNVADNGMGMDGDTLSHLFEPFFTTKEPGKGSGLGLALAYGVVRQSGGHISVHSTLLVGSAFEILLPLVHSTQTVAPQGSLSGPTASRGGEQILLVEADDLVGKMVSGMLAAEGYRVFLARDTREVEQLYMGIKMKIDVLIAEVGCDAGNQRLLRRLRGTWPKLRVLCTHPCGKTCVMEAEKNACAAVLAKPYAISELLRLVRTLIDR